jgi:hypothetical protein
MTRSKAPRRSFLRTWLIWTAGFLVLPLAGFAGAAGATAGLLLHRLLPCPPAAEPRWEQRAVTA